jgi:electron transfer flavoprotein beta subunit
MRIVVCVKQVPDTTEARIDPERGTLIREGVPSILNPLDAHAVEGAVAVCEGTGGEAIALSMGPPQAEEALREAIACGCNRAVLLTHRVFSGSDTWATSYTLACAIRRLGQVGLVFCGKQAIDGDTAQVGPGLAAHLGWPQATYVRRLLEVSQGRIVVERLTDWGNETLRVRLPAVLTVLKDLNVPRLPSLVSQMCARRSAIERWGPDDVGGDAAQFGLDGSPTRVVRAFAPSARGKCVLWQAEPEVAARELVDALQRRKLL